MDARTNESSHPERIGMIHAQRKTSEEVSQPGTLVAYSIGGFVSEQKSKNNLLDLFAPELFSAQSREELMEKLRARAERFYHEASLDEIVQLTQLVESLLETRGLLPRQGSRQIH